jgi:predicted AAA+ superfamily ATPase
LTAYPLCAGRTGQILNVSSLGNDCGIDHKTARAWLSLLEATYVIFLLQPYYKNFGKRLILMFYSDQNDNHDLLADFRKNVQIH